MYSMVSPYRNAETLNAKRGRTKQEFRDECDLNALMKRYEKTGVAPAGRVGVPQYFDASEVPDFHSAMQIMVDAENEFMRLPASVRKQFGNDPTAFIEYATDPKNIDQMREWGLADPKKEPDAPVRVEVVQAPVEGKAPPPPLDSKPSS